ncbi:PD-(D/E)XK motif protein [Sulfuricella sp.]|uniref:PD-(D/E)XK motif protein n=1 Tax=Sulfuricella sp. TaxID=2099377 RepID=UPI002D0FE93E|nr:PD-(D/E)XK motif protein [Sulfuricella sp.]HUX63164.1 PD-(D/E)XK motif protein [Sulfuricella sp.]
MARPIDEFVLAWKALSGSSEKEGWRSIPVSPAGSCILQAGRRFPRNEEALLAGFSAAKIPSAEKLPEGHGFTVERVDLHGDDKTWVALTRKESGSFELFAAMVCDVVGALDAESASDEERLLRLFLGRVRAWQEFMRKGAETLGHEAEIGLIGELSFLRAIVEAGIPAPLAIEAWVGPLNGIQDFELGTGAVEVKATVSASGFPAKIGSLEQLDDSIRQPLFVAGVRFSQAESGENLPEFAEAVRQVLNGDPEAERLFAERLLAAGYFDAHSDRYPRRFTLAGTRVVEVVEGFPRIVTGTVPSGIKRVIYEIDLDKAPGENLGPEVALKRLGVL